MDNNIQTSSPANPAQTSTNNTTTTKTTIDSNDDQQQAQTQSSTHNDQNNTNTNENENEEKKILKAQKKREKDKARKKLKRKKMRQHNADNEEGDQKQRDNDDDNDNNDNDNESAKINCDDGGDDEKSDGENEGMSQLGTAHFLSVIQESNSSFTSSPPKKKVYGVSLKPEEYPQPHTGLTNYYYSSLNQFEKASTSTPSPHTSLFPPSVLAEEKETKQHKGLRCKRCFLLLARDTEFSYKNGQLWVEEREKDSPSQNFIFKDSAVYCSNMHNIGVRRSMSWSNIRKWVPVLKIERTTFKENYLDNPEYQNSSLVVNKMKISQYDGGGEWRRLSLPASQYIPTHQSQSDQPLYNDRYHKVGNPIDDQKKR